MSRPKLCPACVDAADRGEVRMVCHSYATCAEKQQLQDNAVAAERERCIRLLSAAHAMSFSGGLEMDLGPSEFYTLIERIREGK